jgi:hypothetical protein
MIFITFDMDDSRVVYDSPNVVFNEEGYAVLLEPGDLGYTQLQPGDPGYQPPEPTAKRRRSTLSSVANNVTNSPINMSFQFVVVPNPNNAVRPFRARAKLGPQVEEEELLAAVTDDSGVSRADVEKVLMATSKKTVEFMRQTRPLAHVLGLFRAIPSISGSFATNEPSDDAVKAGIGFTLVVGPDADAAMTDGLTVEKVGETGAVKPELENVMLSPGGQTDRYSTSKALKGSGDHFRGSGNSQTWPKAYLLDDTLSNSIELPVFMCSQTEILIGPAPAGTTGTRRLKLVAGWDSTIEFLYPQPLTLLP